jgi:hypothetical protein
VTPTPATPSPPTPPRDGDARDDTYEEQVVSATLNAQSPLDAPNAITIITQQDIRLSGLTSVPELLRRAVGVEREALPGAPCPEFRGNHGVVHVAARRPCEGLPVGTVQLSGVTPRAGKAALLQKEK